MVYEIWYIVFYRGSRVAPLVQCDYCPLLFHMDCLDPPLSTVPSQRWMCPNHVEHAVVSHVVLPDDYSHLLMITMLQIMHNLAILAISHCQENNGY